MVRVSEDESCIFVHSDINELRPTVSSQLYYFGFEIRSADNVAVSKKSSDPGFIPKIVSFLQREQGNIVLDPAIQAILDQYELLTTGIQVAKIQGGNFKAGVYDQTQVGELAELLTSTLARTLKPHQTKAAIHLLLTKNAANFSVPGSGKTSVVLAAFEVLRQAGEVDALYVVGPPSCFGPWRDEYEAVLGRRPSTTILSGGDIGTRRSHYRVSVDSAPDLFLTSFQTLQNDWSDVKTLFEHQGIRMFLVVDEAHYVKQLGGVWATAVLNIAPYATRRVVLSGTPYPKDLSDGFNLFDILWPGSSAIPTQARHRIAACIKGGDVSGAITQMEASVGPLFYRVRKSELGLAPQIFHPPILVGMNRYERLAYDSIVGQVRDLSRNDYFLNLDLVTKLRRGRMMRIRQSMSYTPLLASAIDDYDEHLQEGDTSLASLIMQYDDLEVPGKVEAILRLSQTLVSSGEKLVVWSNFIGTLKKLQSSFEGVGIRTRLIYGETPVERMKLSEEQTREEIIREFLDPGSGVSVLIANPAACAESISLHKQCSHAIYYDLSYNCAQYLQSLDRIHRVGGSENKPSHYYFLQYEETVENDILSNLLGKEMRMRMTIDQDYPIYSLDMFGGEDDTEAYERLFK